MVLASGPNRPEAKTEGLARRRDRSVQALLARESDRVADGEEVQWGARQEADGKAGL